MYRKGCANHAVVKQIQEILGIKITGEFDRATELAVAKYQMDEHIVADGIVGPKTLELMGILDTDQRLQSVIRTRNGLVIERYHLPEGQFIANDTPVPITNDYIFLHHTASWDDPYRTVDNWARDTRGKIGAEFIIGGQNFRDGSKTFDGHILQAFPTGCQAWHLGVTASRYMSRHSVGIELCNFGVLNEDGRNYLGITGEHDQVGARKEFRGYTKWHRYSDAQIKNMERLIKFVAERDSIDLRKGVVDWITNKGIEDAFTFRQEAYEGKVKGLLLHCNISKDKLDLFPQQEVIDMLLSL